MTFPKRVHLDKTFMVRQMNYHARFCREWLREATFEPLGDFGVCEKKQCVASHYDDLMEEITAGESESLHLVYIGVRFTKTATLRVRKGETMIFMPLYVESGSPTVGGIPVENGDILWLKKDVVVEPRFFGLAALTRSYLPKEPDQEDLMGLQT